MATQTPRTWAIQDDARPWTANAERGWHYLKRAQMVRDARERWSWLAVEADIPRLERISVEATPFRKDKRAMPDVAACYPAVKAAIDGLVDACIIADDDPERLSKIVFHSPEVIGSEGLRLLIIEEPI